MKSINILSVLIISLLLQGCLPDSFTKFEEDPAVQAEGGSTTGGSGSNDVCPPGSQLTDPFCLEPTRIEYDFSVFEFDINNQSLSESVELEPNVFNASQVEGYTEYFTFTITPSLPSSTGLSFDVETGIISGTPQNYYEGSHTISAEYTGNTPVSLTSPTQSFDVDLSIATVLEPIISINNPINKTIVLNVDDVTPFTEEEWVSAEGDNGAAKILFIDEVANQLHLDSDDVGADGRFILRTENELILDNRENFSSGKATSTSTSGPVIALTPGSSLTVDDGITSTAIYAFAEGDDTSISTDERETLVYNISPALGNGLVFTEQTACYDFRNPPIDNSDIVDEGDEGLCDTDPDDYKVVPGGTIWGEIDATAELPPTEYTITVANIHGGQAERTIQLSILSPAAPKALSGLAYRQQTGQKLKITVDDASEFESASKISTPEGKTATIDGVDLDLNQLYVTVDNEDDLYFSDAGSLHNSASYFNETTTITEPPTFFYDDDVINDTTEQPFLINQLTPQAIFESAADIEQTRSLTFSIEPNIELLGANFQEQSGCYHIDDGGSIDPNDPDSWDEQTTSGGERDFSECDDADPEYLEIRGGTVWGEFDPDELPVDDTEYSITVETLTGIEFTAPVRIEVTPAQEPAEFSYTQDVLLALQDQSSLPEVRFEEGDFISNNFGAHGVVKEVFTDNTSRVEQLFVWVHVKEGSFSEEQNVDNRQTYGKQAGYIEKLYPINAKLTFDPAIDPADVEDVVIDENETGNIITTSSGDNRARLIYENGADLYVRVTEGTFTTGQTLDTVGETIDNINAQHLALALDAPIPAEDLPVIDSSLVYSDDAGGDDYLGVVNVRSIPDTSSIEVEMVKGELGIGADPDEALYLENPYTTGAPNVEIDSISTNLNRFTGFKDYPIRIAPFVEPGFEVKEYTIEPALPDGLTLDPETGVISGTPTDRSDFIPYTVTISNQFANPTYQPESYTFSLEVKDFFGIINITDNASSYILHKAGMGNGRAPCMVTREQYESASAADRDIECFLEGGEGELFREGMDLQIKVGKDMCQYVENSPYHFARFEADATTGLVAEEVHTGDTDDPACRGLGVNPADPDLVGTDPQTFCESDYRNDPDFEDSDYNCDTGELDYTVRTYEAFDACDCTGVVPAAGAGGLCPEGAEFDAETCGACDDTSSTTETDCDDAGQDWDEGSSTPACDGSATETQSHECGGEAYNCIEGAGTDILTKEQLFENFVKVTGTQNTSQFDVNFSSPWDNEFRSNRHIANFINEPTCSPDTNYMYNYQDLDNIFRTRLSNAEAADPQEIQQSFTGRPFYTFTCRSGSDDVEARIRLIVRDWNRDFRASDNIDAINPDLEQTNQDEELMDLTVIDDLNITTTPGEQTNRRVDHEPAGFGGSCSNLTNVWPDDLDVQTFDGSGGAPYPALPAPPGGDHRCFDCEY